MLDLPFDRWTLEAALAERVRLTPDAPFIGMVGGEVVSYARMQREAFALAEALQAEGVVAGDRVVVMGANCLVTLRCWFALNLLGAVDVTINTAYKGQTLEHAINTAEASLMLVEDRLLDVLARSEQAVPRLQRVLHFSADEHGDDRPDDRSDDRARGGADDRALIRADARSGTRQASLPRFDRLSISALPMHTPSTSDTPSSRWQPPGAQPRDLASIIFTSGTSGPAKGVMLPHAQTYLLGKESAEHLHVTAADTYYVFHPLFHMSPRYVAIYAALIAGAQVRLDRQFSATHWLARIRECGATVTIGHGPMLEMIHAQPERPDDARNPLTRLATSPFPKHIAADFERRFGLRGLEVWGMTEANIPIWNSLDEPLQPGCCGRLIGDHYELRVADPDTDDEVPHGQVGELLVRSRLPWTLMQGYFGHPQATMKAWRNLWFHTGDLVWRNDEGVYHFVDRLGDRIRRRAENISSYDIEVAALTHAAVAECAAVGVPSSFDSDDDIKLAVVARDDRPIDFADLLTHLARRLPHYMVPRYIEQLPALPRTPTNKVRKAALREAGVGPRTWDRQAAGIALRDIV